jgi:hypothetical protein
VSFRGLLGLYAVVPIVVGLVLVDHFLLRGALRSRMPRHPDSLPFFTLLFNVPHLLASHLILLDAEYLRHHGRFLLIGVVVLLPVTYGVAELGSVPFGIATVLVTYFHVFGQQIGLAGAQLRTSDWSFSAWRWSTQATGLAAMLSMSGPAFGITPRWHDDLVLGALVAGVASLAVAWRLAGRSATAGGRRALWANQAMLVVLLGCVVLRYTLFAVAMVRLVHDLSAFYVYVVHDRNRNRGEGRNLVLGPLMRFGVPTFIAGPLLAIVLAFWVQHLIDPITTVYAVYWISAIHYLMESVVWKTGSPHRKHVSFA